MFFAIFAFQVAMSGEMCTVFHLDKILHTSHNKEKPKKQCRCTWPNVSDLANSFYTQFGIRHIINNLRTGD